MNKYKKPKYNEELLGVSPFISSLVIPVNKIAYEGQYKYDADGVISKVYGSVERELSCKLYISPERRKIMNMLSTRAKGLFLWVMYEVDRNKDYMWLNKKRYMEENDINSINTYRNAVDELIRYGLLCKSVVNDVYWINPAMFFGGNRITKYPKKVQVIDDVENRL